MSDQEVPQNKQPDNVDDVVDSANEGLDAAAAARADTTGVGATDTTGVDTTGVDGLGAETTGADSSSSESAADAVDADMEAFAAAERDHPGTFAASEDDAAYVPQDTESARAAEADAGNVPVHVDAAGDSWADARTAPTVADTAYATGGIGAATAAETQVVPAEPIAPPPASPQPIFVQAPEPPRELGNRATAGAIGLLATLAFAILYLGAILGFGALQGTVTSQNVGDATLAPLTLWSYWVPVVVFFIAFWLLGAIINRGRWGHWVIFGIFVAAATYGGHILGQLFQAPFWRITASEAVELIDAQLLAPLAIVAFVFARELTIWFGAWVARAGARKKELNAEAQAEYERTLEAGPGAMQ